MRGLTARNTARATAFATALQKESVHLHAAARVRRSADRTLGIGDPLSSPGIRFHPSWESFSIGATCKWPQTPFSENSLAENGSFCPAPIQGLPRRKPSAAENFRHSAQSLRHSLCMRRDFLWSLARKAYRQCLAAQCAKQSRAVNCPALAYWPSTIEMIFSKPKMRFGKGAIRSMQTLRVAIGEICNRYFAEECTNDLPPPSIKPI